MRKLILNKDKVRCNFRHLVLRKDNCVIGLSNDGSKIRRLSVLANFSVRKKKKVFVTTLLSPTICHELVTSNIKHPSNG